MIKASSGAMQSSIHTYQQRQTDAGHCCLEVTWLSKPLHVQQHR